MAATWIFQANSRRFDIDGFFATRPTSLSYLVTRSADKMVPGDTVFIWRSVGNGSEEDAGVVAECEILRAPIPIADDWASVRFWSDPSEASLIVDRALLKIRRVANKRQIVQRKWLLEDPILRDLTILKVANATNYQVPLQLVPRLEALWRNTGTDWTYAEAVAGLQAYSETYGKEISKLPGSPVANTALLIGRAVTGCYNKVMNYRHLDPREARAGMSGAGSQDRLAWRDFFDEGSGNLRVTELREEFQRFWMQPLPVDPAPFGVSLTDAGAGADADRLTALTLAELMSRYAELASLKASKPVVRNSSAKTYARDPLVVAIALVRANFNCEMPGCLHPIFKGYNGRPYCEVHHLRHLADGGSDTAENVVCLCASHHREIHHGLGRDRMTELLFDVRAKSA